MTAFTLLCEAALPHLDAYLQWKFPKTSDDDREDVIVELLYSYKGSPQQFQPEAGGLSLFAYLRMAARLDMVNAIAKLNREQKHRAFRLDDPDVEDRLTDGNISVEEEIETALAVANFTARLNLDDTESAVLSLMLSGERETAKYVDVIGLGQEDELTQVRKVKQVKDKLTKRLQRLRGADEDKSE